MILITVCVLEKKQIVTEFQSAPYEGNISLYAIRISYANQHNKLQGS